MEVMPINNMTPENILNVISSFDANLVLSEKGKER